MTVESLKKECEDFITKLIDDSRLSLEQKEKLGLVAVSFFKDMIRLVIAQENREQIKKEN